MRLLELAGERGVTSQDSLTRISDHGADDRKKNPHEGCLFTCIFIPS